ncbi:MAG TPA: GNAT family N-acetyltransferase, partial [Polyangiaceae bacterium]|jgi:ribosomal-protein-alanine N-acetyltransferase|nr:GNAT family N-acetyltransferase [Polyangiaceae bacterium]
VDRIETPALRLIALRPEELRALIAGDTRRAGELVGVAFPEAWPLEQDARDGLPWHLAHLEKGEAERAWRVRVVVLRVSNRVIGSVGLKGPPDFLGDVEIGWGIDPEHRRCGRGREAALALLTWAAAEPGVRSFSATIADDNVPSQRLAATLGMLRSIETRRGLPLWRRPAQQS